MTLTRIAPDSGLAWPLHDAAASRAVEAAALAAGALQPATPPRTLMQAAGLAAARLAVAMAPHAHTVDVFAGPGNNGGDGLVAALHLHRIGRQVRVAFFGDAARLPPDAAMALQQALDAGLAITGAPGSAGGHLAIDALLGLGVRRPAEGAIASAIALLNARTMPTLAIDLPSGLHPDTGQPLGHAVRASATLALLTLKPGLFTGAGRDHTGTVWLDTLGCSTACEPTALLAGAPPSAARTHLQHKGSFGDVAVVGGAAGMAGAAWLAARAALGSGAGRVHVTLLDAQAPLLDAARLELMARPRFWTAAPGVLAAATVVCGCGGGAAVRQVLPALLRHAGRLLLDADALNAVAADAGLQALLCERSAAGRPTVLTPHPLEAARLLGMAVGDVQADRLAAATQLARRFGAVAVLKGSGTVVAAPGALPAINPTGNALLATAGTGDVLAGWIGGLWAQRPDDAHGAALAGVWQHGRAADVAAAGGLQRSLRAADLIDAMRAV